MLRSFGILARPSLLLLRALEQITRRDGSNPRRDKTRVPRKKLRNIEPKQNFLTKPGCRGAAASTKKPMRTAYCLRDSLQRDSLGWCTYFLTKSFSCGLCRHHCHGIGTVSPTQVVDGCVTVNVLLRHCHRNRCLIPRRQ